ncbi:MAG: hypothetical protein J7M30_09280 [Deltaproteobacteria bacterium]|nr:hypothetical protein [Deltaproteobacteria bacterium]
MALIENPQGSAGAAGAENRTGCCQNTPPSVFCQPISPASWLVRSNFIESLVSKPFSTERSRKVDFWLIFADFLEGACYGCN